MYEVAARAGADPVNFRLRYIEDPAPGKGLSTAAEYAKWATRPSPKKAAANGDIVTGRGIALALPGGTHVATVAEVEVNRHTGGVLLKKLTCAHDCGLIVNPGAQRGTVAANLVQSTGRVLKEEVTFDRSNVTSTDSKSYPVARWSDIPEVEIVLLNHPETPSTGAGGPAAPRPPPSTTRFSMPRECGCARPVDRRKGKSGAQSGRAEVVKLPRIIHKDLF